MDPVARLEEALGAFEDALARFSPQAPLLRPGLSREDVDAAVAGLPLRLPGEVYTWFAWHDGMNEPHDISVYLPGPGLLMPLDFAVKEYRRKIAGPFGRDGLYRPEWFPLGWFDACTTVVDCAAPSVPTAPIRFTDAKAGETWDLTLNLQTTSIADAVEAWTRVMHEGAWRWNYEDGNWETHWDAYPPELRHLRIL